MDVNPGLTKRVGSCSESGCLSSVRVIVVRAGTAELRFCHKHARELSKRMREAMRMPISSLL